ncbi:hypothetical protein HNY73_019136 [Argiope bruennichi]|uniref:Uncharacterized protein n=1 Tax=Argiope bruennichi TaxID=94029 RepID=A0A8T0EFQ9_ARGBR|nr:hypothetical protein HNY73_019136 [Argiope bruennichi]
MDRDIKIRKVTQDVMLFVWFKHGALSEEPPRESGCLIPGISVELMNNLSISTWIESFRSQFIWEDFFKIHFKRMTSSSKLFANYVAYTCYILNAHLDPYECFFDILSIVTDVSLRCLEGGCEAYLNTCVDLFCAFFEKEICRKFENRGGWENFNKYLVKQYNLMQSKFTIGDTKSPVKLFKYFQNALKIDNRQSIVLGRIVFKERSRHYYVVNGIVLKDVTRIQIETHRKAIHFAESIQDKMQVLVQKTFDEIIMDFAKTYNQVKDLNRRTAYKPSIEIPSRLVNSCWQKDQNASEVMTEVEKRCNRTKSGTFRGIQHKLEHSLEKDKKVSALTINKIEQASQKEPSSQKVQVEYCGKTCNQMKEPNRHIADKASEFASKSTNSYSQKDQNDSDIMASEEEQCWKIVKKRSNRTKSDTFRGIQNNLEQSLGKHQKASALIINKIEQTSQKDQIELCEMSNALEPSSQKIQVASCGKTYNQMKELNQHATDNASIEFESMPTNSYSQKDKNNSDIVASEEEQSWILVKKASGRSKNNAFSEKKNKTENSSEKVQKASEGTKNTLEQASNKDPRAFWVKANETEKTSKKVPKTSGETKTKVVQSPQKVKIASCEKTKRTEQYSQKIPSVSGKNANEREQFKHQVPKASSGTKSKVEISSKKAQTESNEEVNKMKNSGQKISKESGGMKNKVEKSSQDVQKESNGIETKKEKSLQKIPKKSAKTKSKMEQSLEKFPNAASGMKNKEEKSNGAESKSERSSQGVQIPSNEKTKDMKQSSQKVPKPSTRRKSKVGQSSAPCGLISEKKETAQKIKKISDEIKTKTEQDSQKVQIGFSEKSNKMDQSSQKIQKLFNRTINEEEQSLQKVSKVSDERNGKVEQFSGKGQIPFCGMMSDMEQSTKSSSEKFQKVSVDKANKLELSSQKDQKGSDVIKTKAEQTSQKVLQECNVKGSKGEGSLQKMSKESDGTKNKLEGSLQKMSKESDGTKNKLEQSSQKVQNLSGGKSNKLEKSSQKVQNLSSGKVNKLQPSSQKEQKGSDGMGSKIELSFQNALKECGGMRSKVERSLQNVSSAFDGTKNKLEKSSQKVQITSCEKESKMMQASLSVKSAMERIPDKTETVKKELGGRKIPNSPLLKIQNLDNVDSQNAVTPLQAPSFKFASTEAERARKLLDGISVNISRLFELIKPLCEQHGLQVS